MSVEEKIKQRAQSLGFDLIGIASAEKTDENQVGNFRSWLNDGRNGQMRFLAQTPEKRFVPAALLTGAKSVICTAINYKISRQDDSEDSLKIASYALYPDYHIFIKERLLLLADFLKSISINVRFKICVDSSPLAEKHFAMLAGLGFIGKNRLITNKRFGSFLLLGEIVTDMQLKPDEPVEKQDCGKCRKCFDACPAGAISEEGFDARKCISYLTIEHKGEIDTQLKMKIGKHLFGCEECITVCPYNEKTPVCDKSAIGFVAREFRLTADEVLKWTEKDFTAFAKNSAMYRTGLEQIRRNAVICRENSAAE